MVSLPRVRCGTGATCPLHCGLKPGPRWPNRNRTYPDEVPDPAEHRRGLLLGVAAYGLWGAFPLYWPLLEPGGAVEILAHRILWSLLTMGAAGRGAAPAPRSSGRSSPTGGSSGCCCSPRVVITSTGRTYIYGVNNGRVVETSLGYFINPLVTVLMGVLILGERLRPLQWVALGVGAAAVAVLTWDYGRPP